MVETAERPQEWIGQKSAKFTTNKKHLPAPQPENTGKHPLFDMGGRQHYQERRSNEFQFRHSKVAV